jgi:hypothetical protein
MTNTKLSMHSTTIIDDVVTIPTTYLILGHARHGKETVADLIARKKGLRSVSTLRTVCQTVVFPELATRYGYGTEKDCFEDRINHRDEWFQLISAYNTPRKCRLAKTILQGSNIYVGIRSRKEFNACKHLFTYVIWVDAKGRLPVDPACFMELTQDDADLYVNNNFDIATTKSELKALFGN